MKTNQQEKCECSYFHEAVVGGKPLPLCAICDKPRAPSPHQEEWDSEAIRQRIAELILVHKDGEVDAEPLFYEFIQKLLLSLHKANCERFRGMMEELVTTALFDNDLRWTRIWEMIKMRAPISVSDKEYYEKPFGELRTALSKFEEEHHVS